MAPMAALLNPSMSAGCSTATSVMLPSLWMLKVSTTWPWKLIAACGMNQLCRTCATQRSRPGLVQPALRVVERLFLDVLLEVAQRFAKRTARPLARRLDRRPPEPLVGRRQHARLL